MSFLWFSWWVIVFCWWNICFKKWKNVKSEHSVCCSLDPRRHRRCGRNRISWINIADRWRTVNTTTTKIFYIIFFGIYSIASEKSKKLYCYKFIKITNKYLEPNVWLVAKYCSSLTYIHMMHELAAYLIRCLEGNILLYTKVTHMHGPIWKLKKVGI